MSSTKNAASLDALEYVKGTPIDLVAGRGKLAYVVEFWATWCPPCRTSIPHLTELAHKFKGTVEFVGVTSETNKAAVEKFVSNMGDKMDYAVAIDAKGQVSAGYMSEYGVQGIPHAFIVDLNGLVSWHGHPADPEFETQLTKAISVSATTGSAGKADANAPAHHYTLQQIAKMSDSEMDHLSAKDLRGICQEYNVDVTACLEKHDYVEAIRQQVHS